MVQIINCSSKILREGIITEKYTKVHSRGKSIMILEVSEIKKWGNKKSSNFSTIIFWCQRGSYLQLFGSLDD